VSAWLARRGVEVVRIDASPAQLATARRLQREHGLQFPLIEADAERVPVAGDLRPGDLGIRRLPLGRSRSLGRRGRSHSETGGGWSSW
jgi:hypothetical protein